MNKLQSIGTTEFVSLPNDGIKDVPAKIDTGADISAIWATNITEHEGKLSYTLFGKTSPFYTGKPISTQNYDSVSIKNSFGQTERRFKVKLKLTLGGRPIQATVTLANREHNRYPILIGRRTLQGKFVVEVAKNPVKKELNVLLLATKRTTVTENFAQGLEQHGKKLHITYATYDDLCFIVGGPGNSITLIESGRDVSDFDLVYFKSTARFESIAAAVASYLQKRNIPFVDRAVNHFTGSKLYQYVILTDNGIPVPRSILIMPSYLERSYDRIKKQLGLPFVIKDIKGNKGENNFLITNRKSFKEACQEAKNKELVCIAQTFINNDEDYRILIFGIKIALVIKRARTTQITHLNNTSQGADASLEKLAILPKSVQTDSITAAKLLGRQISGVDFVKDKYSGLWYCLEVNEGPQLASGVFRSEKQVALAAYLERKLNK